MARSSLFPKNHVIYKTYTVVFFRVMICKQKSENRVVFSRRMRRNSVWLVNLIETKPNVQNYFIHSFIFKDLKVKWTGRYMPPIRATFKKTIPSVSELKKKPIPTVENEEEDRETYPRCDCLYWNTCNLNTIREAAEEIRDNGKRNHKD